MRLAAGLPYLPIVLLVCTAFSQFILAHAVDLSPWLGGGFGMFSTTDDGVNRELRVFTTDAEGAEQQRATPEALADLAQRARALPSPARLQALAKALATAYAREGAQFSTLRLEVWRTTFDAGDLTPRTQRLRTLALSMDGEHE
jgi:hypothetical protein